MFVNVVVYLFMFYLIMLSVAEIIVLNNMMINQPINEPTGQAVVVAVGFLKVLRISGVPSHCTPTFFFPVSDECKQI
jgi:hypothetical protein